MSTQEKQLDNETLRSLVRKVGGWNPEPARRLWDQATGSDDYLCLIRYSSDHRSAAFERLIEMNPGDTEDQILVYPDTWSYCTPKAKLQIGRIILNSKLPQATRYDIDVVKHVPELRGEAVARIIEVGAKGNKGLTAIWRYGCPAVRDSVWARFLQYLEGCSFAHGLLLPIVQRGIEDLPERAFAHLKLQSITQRGHFNTDLLALLDDLTFADRAWEWLISQPYTRELYVNVIQRYPRFAHEGLQIFADYEGTMPAYALHQVIGWRDIDGKQSSRHLAHMQQLAAEMILALPDLKLRDLTRLLTYEPTLAEVTRRLLAGEFVSDNE